MAEDKAKEHAERMLVLVESPGWREWLNEVVIPLVLDAKSALLQNENLSERDRSGKIAVLRAMKRALSQPYTDAGATIPVVLDRSLT